MAQLAVIENQEVERDLQIATAQLRQQAEIQKLQTEKEIVLAGSQTREETEKALLETKKLIAIAEAKREEKVQLINILNSQKVAIAAADAESVIKENESKLAIIQSNTELARQQAEMVRDVTVLQRQAFAKVEEEEAKAKKLVALANYELVRAQLLADIIAKTEIEKARRVILSETEKVEGLNKVEIKATEVADLELAVVRGKKARLEAEAQYVRDVVSACGGADGAAKYFLVDKVDGLAKHSADAVKNIKFDKVILWDNGGRGKDRETNPAVQFVTDLVSSVAPAGELVKNVLGIDMKEYLGSAQTKEDLIPTIKEDTTKE